MTPAGKNILLTPALLAVTDLLASLSIKTVPNGPCAVLAIAIKNGSVHKVMNRPITLVTSTVVLGAIIKDQEKKNVLV